MENVEIQQRYQLLHWHKLGEEELMIIFSKTIPEKLSAYSKQLTASEQGP